MRKSSWPEYYSLCKDEYANQKQKSSVIKDIYDLTVIEHNQDDPIINRDKNYFTIIKSIADKVDSLLSDQSKYTLRNHCYALDDIWHCEDELVRLGEFLVPQLQEKVFGSYVHVDNIKIYRNFVSKQKDSSSWLWHLDNNPKEQIKVLIYLTDVGAGDGEFTYLKNNQGDGLKVPTSRVSYPDNWKEPWQFPPPFFSLENINKSWYKDRVPKNIISKLCEEDGYCPYSAQGSRGTLFIFDNNIIHKATIPKNNHRDVLILQVKPSITKISPAINKNNTGNGWNHTTFNKDPSVLNVLKNMID